MRIAVLFEYGSINGGENSFLCLVPMLQRHGCQFVAVAPLEGDLSARLDQMGINVVGWRSQDTNGCRRPQSQLRHELETLLVRLSPKIVHANSLAMSRLLGPVAKSLNVHSIGHLRDILRVSKQAILDLNENHRLLAVSRATRDWHINQGVDEARMFVCHNGVDLDQYRPRSRTQFLHEELSLPSDATLMGYIGQLGMRKGIDTWLRAARLLAQDFPLLHFLIVGQKYSTKAEAAEHMVELGEIAASTELRGRVHWLGRRTDIPRLLNELTILVHAARQEPLGRVLLEAAASGTPMVATRVGGTEEILPPAEFADCLVPPEDVATLTPNITRMLQDPRLRHDVATKLRKRAEEQFSADFAGDQLMRHYREMID